MTVRQAIRTALQLLDSRDRRLLGLSMIIQMSTSFLDLLGVLLLGLVGALAVTVVQSQPPPTAVAEVANGLGLGELSGQELIGVFAASAAAVLLAKSILSSYLTRRVLIFLANRQALVSARLTKELLQRPLTFLHQRTSQETAYALVQGAGAATVQILGQTSIAATEATLLAILAVALLLLDPVVTLAAVTFFALVALVLQMLLGMRASRLGRQSADYDIQSLGVIQDALASYREVVASDRRSLYVSRIQSLRWQAASIAADTAFLGLLPKYVFEAALVLGGFALAGALFATQSAVSAVGTLALFLAAASRVMPSLLRLQTAALTLRAAAGNAGPTFALAQDLDHPTSQPDAPGSADRLVRQMSRGYPDFRASISMEHVSFRYPQSEANAIEDLSFRLGEGRSLALVGPSGAGKSTVADLILGVLTPSHGEVWVGGVAPENAVSTWPGGIGYVPQEVAIARGSIRDNVALGLPRELVNDDRVWGALARAHLEEYVQTHPDRLDAEIGERGIKLSGGQRQRLGIARALYSWPKLLILDEATSALDAETESAITATISGLEGEVTTVIVAHRLSTVRHADLVLYIDAGRVLGAGNFTDVRRQVSAFDSQAALLGL